MKRALKKWKSIWAQQGATDRAKRHYTAAKVLHDDAAILAAGDVDGVAVAVAGLVDGVGDDLKNRMGAALHTVRPEDDGRAFADAVRTL